MACYILLCVLRNKQIKIMAKRKFKSKKSADSFAKRVKGKVNDCTMNDNTDANYTVVFKHIKQSKDISYGVGKSNVSQEYYT